jgi:hypothetical protein
MDNRYYKYDCPPLMNDGRFISSYERSSTFDQKIRNINNIYSAHEFRNYIQSNGSTIINNIKSFLHDNNTCSVEGRCLPLSGSADLQNVKSADLQNVKSDDLKSLWYEDLLDEQPAQLDFMMHTNSVTHDNLDEEPTNDDKETCTTCHMK